MIGRAREFWIAWRASEKIYKLFAMDFFIREIKDRFLWDAFLSEAQPHTFLHDWEWGQVHTVTGGKMWRFGIFEGEKLCGIALILKISARRGSFLFCPHGPILGNLDFQIIKNLREHLIALGKKENCSFIRISSLFLDTNENRKMFRDLDFRSAPIHMHSELGWLTNIEGGPDEIQKKMRKTTRHEIRASRTAGVELIMSSDIRDLKYFFEVYETTVARKHFVPFSRLCIEKEFQLFREKDKIQLFLGKHKNQILYAALIVFSNGSAFYHHGASRILCGEPSASHFVQWSAMMEAKRRGCTLYNFWGVSPENKKNHPWAGTSRFKRGFGGFEESYVHAQDFVLGWKYAITFAVESARKYYRGL